MIRNISSNRIRSITYDTDFQNKVLDVSQTRGFLIPPFATRVILNKLMKDMKNIGFYQSLDTFANFAIGDGIYSNFSRVDWVKLANIYTPDGEMTYNSYGIKGNGIDAYLDTNFNPATMGVNYTLNYACRGLVVSEYTSSYLDGLKNAAANYMYSAKNTRQYINTLTSFISPGERMDLQGFGFKMLSRDSSSTIRAINSNLFHTELNPSSIITSETQVILRRTSFYSTNGISVYFMGGSISNTTSQDFRMIYNEFLSRLNLNPIA